MARIKKEYPVEAIKFWEQRRLERERNKDKEFTIESLDEFINSDDAEFEKHRRRVEAREAIAIGDNDTLIGAPVMWRNPKKILPSGDCWALVQLSANAQAYDYSLAYFFVKTGWELWLEDLDGYGFFKRIPDSCVYAYMPLPEPAGTKLIEDGLFFDRRD